MVWMFQELAPDPKSTSPSLSCRRYLLKPSAELPTDQLGISATELLPHLDKEDAFSLISDVTVSPCLKKTLSPTPVPKLTCWSPVGILHNRRWAHYITFLTFLRVGSAVKCLPHVCGLLYQMSGQRLVNFAQTQSPSVFGILINWIE